MYDLMALEIEMQNTANKYTGSENIYMEANIIDHISVRFQSMLRKLVAEMKAFSEKLVLSITSAQNTLKQQRLLSRIEKELKSGRQTPVELVDTEYITKLFRKDIDKLSKEVSKIGKELTKFSIKGPEAKIERYMNKKAEISAEIEQMIVDLDAASKKRIIIPPMKARLEIERIIGLQKMYTDCYNKLIADFNIIMINFERNIAKAEADQRIRSMLTPCAGQLQDIKMGATKMVRKAVFAVSVVVG